MKIIICFCFLTFFITSSIAQMVVSPQSINDYKVVDSSKYVIKYSLDFTNNPDKPEKKDSDIIVLEIGKCVSKSYSYNLFKFDSIYTNGKNNGIESVRLLQKSVPPVEVFKNYPKGKMSVVYRSPFQGPVFKYVEDEFDFNWSIHLEKKNILGYSCQKATTIFRGRKWTAWFSIEIPVSDGPWKFCGLPGLILSVSDDKEHYLYNCVSVNNKKSLIKIWDWDYENITRENLCAFLKKAYENPMDYMKTIGSGIVFVGQSEAESKKISYPFNPIELE
ncbi:MAG: Uncharacterized protein XD81_1480 [Bacteroidetes bacterium 38_7]|nr:MAG: Uncharacterized protein XD81_1480 [Bacteroidetes bacterium 38_7]HAL64614.1 hypothetical protein [Bacteroidales bacterium]